MMQRPIRVLHVIDGLAGGGAERMIWDLIRLSDQTRVIHRVVTVHPHRSDYAFAERLHSVGAYDLPASDTAAEETPKTQKKGYLRRSSDSLHRLHRLAAPVLRGLPEPWKRPVWKLEELIRSLPIHERLLTENARFAPDIIHGHVLSGFRFGLVLHYLTGKPYVCSVTGFFAQWEKLGQAQLISQYHRFRSAVARWFIAEPYMDDLAGIAIPRTRIGALRGVVDIPAIKQAWTERERHRHDIRRSLEVPDDALLALSVGRWDPSKGHEHAVDALPSIVKNFARLHWVALGHGWQVPDYAERARALGVGEHAHIVGYRDDPLPYYAAADLYLRTPIIEADTLSSYTAMAMGVPVVGFDTGCATELVPSVGHGVLVKNANPIALADGVRQILSLPDRGRAMGDRGREHAIRHLDITLSVDEFVNSYEQVMNQHQIRSDSRFFRSVVPWSVRRWG